MIAVIDYDMGNLKSVSKALERVGGEVCVTRDAKKIRSAKKIVLPGVGAFPKCMENLNTYGLAEVIADEIRNGKPFLGICLGFQLLFEESEEFGPCNGLGIMKGRVKRFSFGEPAKSKQEAGSRKQENQLRHLDTYALRHLKVPHMGWNRISKVGDPPLLKGIPDKSYFYFVHSYYVEPADKKLAATQTDYGIDFCSSIATENLFACQFHPEKSQKNGLKLLENFVNQ